MSERKKKTGDVATWTVVDVLHLPAGGWKTREEARIKAREWDNRFPRYAPHRIAKVVLAK